MLKPNEDAYGQAMLDYTRGEAAFEVFELDNGFVGLAARGYLPALYFSPEDSWFECEREALARASGRVLDVGCGAGRHALHLASRGLEVVAIDNSPTAIQVCRERGVADARVMSILDVGPTLGSFDTILMLGSNFALLQSVDLGRQILRQLHSMLAPRGKILTSVSDPYRGPLADYCEWNRARDSSRMPGQFRMRIRYKRYSTPWFDSLNVSPEEMQSIVEGTGFRVSQLFGEHTPYAAVLERVGA